MKAAGHFLLRATHSLNSNVPRTDQPLDQLFPATLQNVLSVLGPGISGEILKMPGHTHSHPKPRGPKTHASWNVIFTAKSEEPREFRRGQEDRVWGRGLQQEKVRREKEEMGKKRNREEHLLFKSTVSGLNSLCWEIQQKNGTNAILRNWYNHFKRKLCSTINTHNAESP